MIDEGIGKILIRAMKNKKYGLKRLYRYGYDHNPVTAESRIKIENMKADVLFLAVKNDDAWPSDIAVLRMAEILKKSKLSLQSAVPYL